MKTAFLILFFFSIVFGSCNRGARKQESNQKVDRHFEITEIWSTDTILLTPESVIYNKNYNIFYVSNMNLEPRKKDGNGFISRIDREGNIIDLHWIEGLSSPKGLALVEDTLFAADVDEIVAMDVTTGKIIRRILIEGAGMLNDITSDSEGTLFVSDTDANKIYQFKKGEISVWYDEKLTGPNGLLWEKDRLLVASQGSHDLKSIKMNDKRITLLTDSINRADGIVWTGMEGYYIVTDWEGEIFMINPDYSKTSLLRTKEQGVHSADIEYVPSMNILLVPTFFNNRVVAYKLSERSNQ
jgi:outer membrane protein assembly factor BamB